MNWKRFVPGKRAGIILGVIILILVVIRLALPSVIKHYVNKTLDEIPGYYGHVDDISVHLYRGAYEIGGIRLEKTSGKVPVPFFSAADIELSIEWFSLIHGHLVGTIDLVAPHLNFVSGPTEAQSQKSMDNSWLDKVKKLFPLKINSFQITDGEIHFRNYHSDPGVDLFINKITAQATNLTNSLKLSKTLLAHIDAVGEAMGHAAVKVICDLDPYAEQPTFALDLSIDKLQMERLNDYLRAYAKLDVKGGTFGCYAEFAAADGGIKGYLKPIMKDLKIVDWGKDIKTPVKLLWEAIVGVVADIFFTNQKENQVATRIPIEGRFKDPHTNIFAVLGGLLENAFIRALIPGIEGTVHLKDATGIGEKK